MKNNQKELFDVPNFSNQSNVDIEECVLSCFISYPDTYTDNADAISIEEFSTSENRIIFHAIQELVANNKKIDLYTISNFIRKNKWDEFIETKKSGFDIIIHVEDVYERINTDEHIRDHILELNQYSKRRALNQLSEIIANKVNEFDEPEDIIETVSKELYDIQQNHDVEDVTPIESIQNWVKSKENPEKKLFIRTGLKPVDEFIYGFQPPDQVIVAAAPSMGKTSFALQMLSHNIQAGVPCGVFSLEMNYDQLFDRMIALNTGISLRNLMKGQINQLEWGSIHKFIAKIEDKQFYIDDKSSKLSAIRNKIRKWVIRHKVKLVIVDYLQLVICDNKVTSREQEVAMISRSFKELARELDIVIIPLSQLNRNNASRADKRPVLSDLRESGSIEQDADVVMFIHREEYYQPGQNTPIENAEIIFAKGRSIGTGSVDVMFQSSLTKFYGSQEDLSSYQIQMLHSAVAMNQFPDEIRPKEEDNSDTPF